MAYKLHSAKTYKVEYASHSLSLSEDEELLNKIFDTYDVMVYRESSEQAESWEIEANDFARVLDNLERENKDMYTILKEVYDTADKSDGYVHLFWF